MRLAIVALCFSFVTLVIASILLIPSNLLSSQKEDAAQRHLETLTKSVANGKSVEFDSVLSETKTLLGLLGHTAPKVFLHEALVTIVSQKSDSISLTNFSFTQTSKGKWQAIISGIAADRAALSSFVKAIEQSKLFETVEVPLSDFAKDATIPFSITARGAF